MKKTRDADLKMIIHRFYLAHTKVEKALPWNAMGSYNPLHGDRPLYAVRDFVQSFLKSLTHADMPWTVIPGVMADVPAFLLASRPEREPYDFHHRDGATFVPDGFVMRGFQIQTPFASNGPDWLWNLAKDIADAFDMSDTAFDWNSEVAHAD